MKIFRKIRQKLISENKVTSYILYAIGEILLVMIGILLALQVNNWNEERTQQRELKNILKTVSLDLQRDTLVASGIIKFYEENEKSSLRIINKEITIDNYKECPSCASLVSVYKPFTIQTKGFDLIKNFSNQNTVKNDSLITNITQFYTILKELIDDSNGFIKNEVISNINSFKKQPWFVDWTQGHFTKEMIMYFSESEDYRKRVASHNLLASKNHLLFVSLYNKGAKEILQKIEERLNKK
jgi:Family of unknown function (DUF6090)